MLLVSDTGIGGIPFGGIAGETSGIIGGVLLRPLSLLELLAEPCLGGRFENTQGTSGLVGELSVVLGWESVEGSLFLCHTVTLLAPTSNV